MRYTFILLLFGILPFTGIGQESHSHTHAIDPHDDHEHHNHIGLASGPVYVFHEKEFAPGLHLHYARLIDAPKGQFGLGLGLEAIFDEHRHYATSINFSYLPIHNLTFTVAPGIQFGPESEEFTTHFEVSYEFILGEIHIGPVFEYAYADHDAHAMLGIHLGFGF